MKVIIANYRYFVAGGPEKYMFKFMEAAQKRGIEVIPFSVDNPQNEDTPYKRYFAKPRSKQLLYADMKKSLGNAWGMLRTTVWNFDAERRLRRLIRDTKPDAVYILHEINHLSPSIIRAAKKENVRVIHRISDFFMFCPKYDFLCGDEICEACIHGDYRKAIQKRCVKGSRVGTHLRVFAMRLYKWARIFDDVDHFVCTCEFSREKLIEGGIEHKKITVVPTFIDSERIAPCYENEHYFLFLGRMAHQKGTIYSIEAMKWLQDTDYVLKITGQPDDSEEDKEIVRYIQNNNLQEKVIFTGFKKGKDLEEFISKATCVLCPAIWYENMPNTVIEAYAYGKPIIASNVGSLAEIVEDEKTGFLFEIKNSKDMAERMKRFVSNPELSEILGRNAREVCEARYNEERHMNILCGIFNKQV